MNDSLITLASVTLGRFLAAFGGYARDRMNRRAERRTVAAAFRAEIVGILQMVETRQHEAHYEQYLDILTNNRDPGYRPRIYGLTSYEIANKDSVFDSHVDKLGTLPHYVVADIIKFYSIVRGVRTDLVAIHLGDVIAGNLVKTITNDLELWNCAKKIGTDLDNELAKLS